MDGVEVGAVAVAGLSRHQQNDQQQLHYEQDDHHLGHHQLCQQSRHYFNSLSIYSDIGFRPLN